MSEIKDDLTSVAQRSSSRRRWLLGLTGGAAALAGAGFAWWRLHPTPVAPSAADALWGLTLDGLDDRKIELASFRGKPTVINFWATWCPPCVAELPLLDRFYQENKANGWQVVGIAVDQRDPVNRFLTRIPLKFPVALAGMGGIELGRALGNLGGGLPFTVVLGSNGVIAHRKMGQISPDDLKGWLALK